MSADVTIDHYKSLLEWYCPKPLIEKAFELNLRNDKAHDINHVYYVTKRAMEIAIATFPDSRDIRRQVAVAAMLHDIGCSVEREHHHSIGARMAENLLTEFGYTLEDISIISGAIENHRASYKGVRRNAVEEIVAVADRGSFNYELFLKRTVQCRIDGIYGTFTTLEEMADSVYVHMVDKFGPEGYCWKTYPSLGMKFYANEIETIRQKVTNKKQVIEDAVNCYNEMCKKE